MNPQEPIDYSKPVAYDTNGRPLYARPPEPYVQNTAQQMPVVHTARPLDPEPLPVSPELQRRHDESARKYPNLNLSDGEYVISAVRRHPFGLIPILGAVAGAILGLGAVVFMYANYVTNGTGVQSGLPPVSLVAAIAIPIAGLFIVGGFVAVWIYSQNRFYLTNESVIQEIQNGLFSKHEQTVSLINIEDASFSQETVTATLFNYGSIRLSTEGDETTYRFNYVANPKRHIATLNNAVEAFKNGRPVVSDSDN